MKSLLITAAVAACASHVSAQNVDLGDLGGLGDIFGGIMEGGDPSNLDLGKLEEWGKQLEEASKNCDTEKLNTLAEACGNSIENNLRSCTSECKALFAFMGEDQGCGELYDQFGFGNIEQLCNGGTFEDVITGVPDLPSTTDTPSEPSPEPSSGSSPSPSSGSTTTSTPSSPSVPSSVPTTSGTMAGAVVAAGIVLLATV